MIGPQVEVVVVGAGPIGLATSIALRLRGLSVATFDRGTPPIDKPCGEGLMPEGVEILTSLGAAPPAAAGRLFRGLRFVDRDLVLDADFPAGRFGRGLRRPVLHAALLRRAEEVGVQLFWNERVDEVEVRAPGGSRGEEVGRVRTSRRCLVTRFVVAADGLRSPLRRAQGLERPVSSHPRFGLTRHYRVAPWSDRVEIYFGETSEAYVTPVSETEVGVALLWTAGVPASVDPRGARGGAARGSTEAGIPGREATPRFDHLLAEHPRLTRHLGGAEPSSPDLGTGPLERRVAGRRAGSLYLVGDAAGYVDAITGEGLTLGLRQAVLLAETLAAGAGARWDRRARRVARRPTLVVRAMLYAEARPRLRRRLLEGLGRQPKLLASLVALHAESAPFSKLGLSGAVRLGGWLAQAALRGEMRRSPVPAGAPAAPGTEGAA